MMATMVSPMSHDPFPQRSVTRRLLGVEEKEGQSECGDCNENHE